MIDGSLRITAALVVVCMSELTDQNKIFDTSAKIFCETVLSAKMSLVRHLCAAVTSDGIRSTLHERSRLYMREWLV